MSMTTTGNAAFTLANLPTEGTITERYLQLLDWSKTELTALEPGARHADPDRRRIQAAMWTAQFGAQQDIVLAAIAAGCTIEQVQAITWRDVS